MLVGRLFKEMVWWNQHRQIEGQSERQTWIGKTGKRIKEPHINYNSSEKKIEFSDVMALMRNRLVNSPSRSERKTKMKTVVQMQSDQEKSVVYTSIINKDTRTLTFVSLIIQWVFLLLKIVDLKINRKNLVHLWKDIWTWNQKQSPEFLPSRCSQSGRRTTSSCSEDGPSIRESFCLYFKNYTKRRIRKFLKITP